MPVTARELINGARERHPAFTEQRIPTRTLVPVLSDLQRRFVEQTIQIDEDAIQEEIAVPLPLEDFDAGYQLPDHHYVRSIVAGRADGSGQPIEIIPSAHRFARNGAAAAGWVVGGKLFLRGSAQSWSAYDSLAVAIVPVPADFDVTEDLGAQEILLPVTARGALIDGLALYMAGRVGKLPADVPPVRLTKFQADADGALAAYLNGVRVRAGNQTFRIMDVFP